MKRRKCLNLIRASLVTATLVVTFGAGNAWGAATSPDKGGKKWRPAEIQALIREEARNIGLPVALALAVGKVESDFRPHLVSHKGARGVMQIMPATAMDEYAIPAKMLWNPRINVRLGLHFLKRLLVRYRGRVDLALSYYNGGSRVGDHPTTSSPPVSEPPTPPSALVSSSPR